MAWTSDQLARIADAEVLQVSSYRSDGTLRRWTPIWVVRVGDGLYVRTAYGRDSAWYPMIGPTAAETTVRLDTAD